MKKFFAKIVSFLQTLFTNLDAWIHDHVQPSIEFLQKIKAAVESPLADVIAQLIPGTTDDHVKAWIQVNITKAINLLAISKKMVDEKDWEKKIKMLLEYLKILSPEERKGYYYRLASLMARSSGGTDKVKGHSVDLLTALQYSKLVEGVEASDLAESKYTAKAENKTIVYDAPTGTYKEV